MVDPNGTPGNLGGNLAPSQPEPSVIERVGGAVVRIACEVGAKAETAIGFTADHGFRMFPSTTSPSRHGVREGDSVRLHRAGDSHVHDTDALRGDTSRWLGDFDN